MFGAAEVDQGLEKLECSFELHEWSDTVIRNWGGSAIDGTPLRFMGALEKDDEGGSVTSVQASVRGRTKVLDFGDVKQGDANPLKAEMALTYFRYEHDGKELIEIDVVNMIEKVNGTDRLAAQRAAIGL